MTEAPTGKRLIAAAYDESAAAFAVAADRLVYRYLARPLVDAIGPGDGRVLDVAAGLVSDTAARRRDAAAALAALPERQLDWHAALIVGVGRRR